MSVDSASWELAPQTAVQPLFTQALKSAYRSSNSTRARERVQTRERYLQTGDLADYLAILAGERSHAGDAVFE